jgi:hypothetical protein
MRLTRVGTLLVLLALAPFCRAQAPTPAPGSDPRPAPQAPEKKDKKEHKISEKEAKQLFEQVDEILKFVSQDTGLAIKHPVKRALANREQVRAYLEEQNKNDADKKRLERTAIVLKKLGLLPRDFDLAKYLDDVLEEQVAGYYDSKTKTIYLLDWIEPETQKAVLAHELTHALQDQNYDLEKFQRKGAKEEDQSKDLKAHEGIEVRVDEPGTARQAIVEGQAMIVLYDYVLSPSGRSVADSPDMVRMMKAGAQQGNEGNKMLMHAPMYLRDAILFPYTYGFDFEEAMLHRGGKQLAFTGVLTTPPRNTREVMEPKVYAAGEQLPPISLPEMRKLLGKDYEPYDVGNLGEFDVHVLLKQFAGEKTADKLGPHWRGGAYYAAERRAGMAGKATDCAAKPADAKLLEAQNAACLAVLIETRWDTPASAAQFAERYAALLLVKYRFAQTLTDESGKPEEDRKPGAHCFTCFGGERWLTDEGQVTISQLGASVLVLETFDDALTPRLQQAVLPQPAPSLKLSPPQ